MGVLMDGEAYRLIIHILFYIFFLLSSIEIYFIYNHLMILIRNSYQYCIYSFSIFNLSIMIISSILSF
jgi:hypothetical protein